MAKKFIKTKYGTKINVEGLTDEQIKKVRSIAEDNGAYGAKGAALANELRTKNEGIAKTQQQPTPAGVVKTQPVGAPVVIGAGTQGAGAPSPELKTQGAAASGGTPAGAPPRPKTIKTKYGTVINVEGLTDEQIKKVRSIAEDKGAYGTKGAALAKELQGKNKKKQEQPAPNPDPNPNPNPDAGGADKGPGAGPIEKKLGDLGVKKDGTIDGAKAGDVLVTAENSDASRTFNMNNPGRQRDAFGNEKIVTIDPKTGEVSTEVQLGRTGSAAVNYVDGSITNADRAGDVNLDNEIGKVNKNTMDLSGAPRILESNDVRTEAQKVGDANYKYLTRNFERDKRRELEATKQELANRGIPIDFGNSDSMWNKAVGSIDQKFTDADLAASNQALMSRDQSMTTLAGVQTGARDAFVKSAQAEFDATNTTARDSAALKTTQATAAQNQLTNALGAAGVTTGDFTAYAGGSVDNSGQLANLIGQMNDAELARYGIDKDYAAKMKAIAAQGRNSGGGGGSSNGGFAIGGVAP